MSFLETGHRTSYLSVRLFFFIVIAVNGLIVLFASASRAGEKDRRNWRVAFVSYAVLVCVLLVFGLIFISWPR